LLQAADHLEAAGLKADAAKLRKQAGPRRANKNDLRRKEAELECLQSEVENLRLSQGEATSVVLEFVALEVHRDKLGLKARAFEKMIGMSPMTASPLESVETSTDDPQRLDVGSREFSSTIVDANPARLPLFKELREAGAIRVLCEPTLVTAPNCPAKFFEGGQLPVKIPSDDGQIAVGQLMVGTHVDVIPTILTPQQLRIQAIIETSELSPNQIVDVEGNKVPRILTRRFQTEASLQIGQTLTFGRYAPADRVGQRPENLNREADHSESRAGGNSRPSPAVETVVFVTPRLIHGEAFTAATASTQSIAKVESPEPIFSEPAAELGPPVPVLRRSTAK
jgi:hypothetical protein